MKIRQLFTILLTVWLFGSGTEILAQANSPAREYPQPPVGIHWGWQGHVLFKIDSAKIQKTEKPLLNQIVELLYQHPNVNILITGRTDNTGDIKYNQRLSVQRMNAVLSYLIDKGIPSQRIVSQATGEQRPTASNACPEDRLRNRRADLAFFPSGYEPQLARLVSSESQPQPGECEAAREETARQQLQRR
jgi:outer membrane protein OmpA-like peptidoglycan-associated protein